MGESRINLGFCGCLPQQLFDSFIDLTFVIPHFTGSADSEQVIISPKIVPEGINESGFIADLRLHSFLDGHKALANYRIRIA